MDEELKTCFRCETPKPRSEFYRHPQMADGLLGKCKGCTQVDVRLNRQRRLGYYREFDRRRANLPKRVAARKSYARTPQGKASHTKSLLRWVRNNPHKRRAQIALGNAVRDGRVIRQPCEVCGGIKSQAHHDDYSKPFDVRWLCPKHHRARHVEMRQLTEAA